MIIQNKTSYKCKECGMVDNYVIVTRKTLFEPNISSRTFMVCLNCKHELLQYETYVSNNDEYSFVSNNDDFNKRLKRDNKALAFLYDKFEAHKMKGEK